MATYDYETSVNINGNYKEKPPRKEGFTTYVKGSVDVTKAGEYIITYTFIKQDPFESITETRLVTVVDTYNVDDSPAPEVYLNGDNVVTISQGSSWTDPGAYAIDPRHGGSSRTTFIDVNTVLPIDGDTWASQAVGNYSILYYAVSSGNRIGFATRTVSIVAASITVSLNGCSKLYIEYPSSGDVPSYVGQNFSGSGSNITIDAGYSVSGSNYSVQIGVKPEDDGFYRVAEDNTFFTADPDETKTYEIYYKVTSQDGYEKTSVREVIMMKDGETDATVLSGLEFQKNSSDGCADRDPVVSEDDLLKNDLEEYGDSVFDDPILSPTPTDAPNPQTNDGLFFLCAGSTAFSGGLIPSTWNSNPGKIPNQIVESWYAPASTRTVWDTFFTVVNGAYMPGETEKTQWTGRGGAIVWQLHKIHSETKVTYSYGYGLGSAPILYSTWEPYYENGARVGDIFYGVYGAHIFLESEGWAGYLSKDSFSFKELMEERTYRSMAPYSFTRVTQPLKDMHLAKISAANIPEESVFQDDNKQILSNGAVLHSVPIFRGIDEKIARGGTGVVGEDMISLSWRSIGGATDVSKYCDYTVQERLPLYCNTVFDKYESYDGSNPHSFAYEDSIVGPVPGTIFEVTWTENPNFGSSSLPGLYRYSLIHINQRYIAHTWYLVQIRADRATYMLSNGGDQRDMIIDPDNPTKNKFTGILATYSFDRLHAPAIYSSYTYNMEALKYITNFDAADRIPEPSQHSSLSTSYNYYNSLMFGGQTSGWVSPSSGSSGSYKYGWQNGPSPYFSRNWTLLGDPVEPC